MNIARTWANLTTCSTGFTRGRLTSERQFDAAEKAEGLERLVDQVTDQFRTLQTDPGQSVCGSIVLNDPYCSSVPMRGNCQFDAQGRLLEMTAFGPYDLSVRTTKDGREICATSYLSGSGSGGSSTFVTEQWVKTAGSKVNYKSFTYEMSGER